MKWTGGFLTGVLVGGAAALAGVFFYQTIAVKPASPAARVSAAVAPPIAPVVIAAPEAAGRRRSDPAPEVSASALAAAAVADSLLIPVAGVSASQLNDTFNDARGTGRSHEALDILAPKGTQVLAVAAGKIVKLFDSKPGGLTVYQFDTSEKFAYYYAHLDHYAAGIREGTILKRGDLVGYVGTTGNADPATPHLHFAIFELGPEKQWWKGTPINPYPLLGGTKRP